MAGITFDDGTGSVTLRGIFPAPLDRLRGFTPRTVPLGVSVSPITTRRPTFWSYGTIFAVSFELPHLSQRMGGGESGVSRANRLIAHLIRGGVCSLLVEDLVSTAAVSNCYLLDGAQPELTLANPQDLLYSLSLTLANTTTPFVANYGGVTA
jgi:hypothetical protein